jgi:glycosyltransferase involved in cell wall biosynthesis
MKPITQPKRTSLRPPFERDSPDAPRVSVIIPTRNRADLVGRAIASVLRQTIPDLELIVVDDRSRDNTAEVVTAIDDPRLHLVRLPKNGGVSHARNAGIARARGEWVGFLDDDDEWLPELLQKELARLARSPEASAVYCLRACVLPDGKIKPSPLKPPLPEGDVSASILVNGQTISPSAYVVRRSALLEVGGFDESFVATEDRDLWLRLSQAGHRFAAVPEALTYMHDGHKVRLTEDAVVFTRGFVESERRWNRLAKRIVAPDAYQEWRSGRHLRLQNLNDRQVKRFARKGKRRDAWRYVRRMTPAARTYPWLAPYIAMALAVVVLGQRAEPLVTAHPKPGRATRTLDAERGGPA